VASSNILTSAAHRANVYQYETHISTQLNHSLFKNGLATSSHHRLNNILDDGIFLLCHRASFNGNNHSNLSSALLGASGQILNGISYIGVSIVKGSLSNHSEYINGLIDDQDCLGLLTISFCH
jgi:hypothetical protein